MRYHQAAGRLAGWAIWPAWRRYSTGRTESGVARAAAAAWKAEKQPSRRASSSLSSVGRADRWITEGKVWGNPLTEVTVIGAWVITVWRRRQVSRRGGRSGKSTGRKRERSDLVEARAEQMPLRGPRARGSSMIGARRESEGLPPAKAAERPDWRRVARARAASGWPWS